ncbi:MAG: zinc ABC transporter substrate-binding protein [Pseudomonadota bacterium]|nr:zinc ABC transporter substrate-binding protein [Pseudomonadota bacterium]
MRWFRQFGRDVLRRFAAPLAAAALALGLPAAARAQSFTALATVGMIGDIVKNVVGDTGRVEVLLGAGVDPHTYKATRGDIAKLLGADIVFYNGLLLEGKMTDALIRVANSGRPVVAVTEALGEEFLLEPEGLDGQFDPHVWMDVRGWMRATEVVRDRLTAFRPALAENFARNAARYLGELEALDGYARRVLASVPAESRVLITAHDAFNYFGRAYGFEVLGIQGISTESEAGLRRIAELVDLIVSRKIRAVFVETTVSDRNVNALIEGAAAKGHAVTIGGELFSDAMGAPGTYEGTYIGMIDHNTTVIAAALGGQPPERGMDGRLARR